MSTQVVPPIVPQPAARVRALVPRVGPRVGVRTVAAARSVLCAMDPQAVAAAVALAVVPRVEVPLIVAATRPVLDAAAPWAAPAELIARRTLVRARVEVAEVAGIASPDARRVLRLGIRRRVDKGRGEILDRVTRRTPGLSAGGPVTPVRSIRAVRAVAHIGLASRHPAGHDPASHDPAGHAPAGHALVRVAIKLLAATNPLRPVYLLRIDRRRPKAGADVRRPNTRPATLRGMRARNAAKKGSGFRRYFRGPVLRRVVR